MTHSEIKPLSFGNSWESEVSEPFDPLVGHTNFWNRPNLRREGEVMGERTVVRTREPNGEEKSEFYYETKVGNLYFLRRDQEIIAGQELDGQLSIVEVLAVPEDQIRQARNGEGDFETVALFGGIGEHRLSRKVEYLHDVYQARFWKDEEGRQKNKDCVRFWLADFGGELKNWSQLEFQDYTQVAYLQAYEKAIKTISRRVKKLHPEEKVSALLDSFSAITAWHLIMARAKDLVEGLADIPEGIDFFNGVFEPEKYGHRPDYYLAFQNPSFAQALDFFRCLKGFEKILLVSPTILTDHVRWGIIRASIHDVARKRITSKLIIGQSMGKELKAVRQTARGLVNQQSQEKQDRIRSEYGNRAQTLEQLTVVFKKVFRGWYKKYRKKLPKNQEFLLVDMLCALKAGLPPLQIFIGGKDGWLNPAKVLDFLTAKSWKKHFFGPLVELFQIHYQPGAKHGMHRES